MAEIVGTTAGVVGLVGAASAVVREIRTACDRVQGATKTLDDTSQQLTTLERSLSLVEEEEALQTADVMQQVRTIIGIADELKALLDKRAIKKQKRPTVQVMHTLKSGDREERELQGVLDRLDAAKGELTLRISVAQVGLVGNLQDGFRVAFGVLIELNDKVKQVLGINLALMDRLRDRALQQTADRMIMLDTSDEEALGLRGGQQTTQDTTTQADETSIYDNITAGQARIITGDIGLENWQRVVGRKTTIARNRFGGDVRIITGNLGGEAAVRFNENFWG